MVMSDKRTDETSHNANFNIGAITQTADMVEALRSVFDNRVLWNNNSNGGGNVEVKKLLLKTNELVQSDGLRADVTVTLLSTNYFQLLMSNAHLILKHEGTIEETLRSVLIVVHTAERHLEMTNVSVKLFKDGGLIFAIKVLKSSRKSGVLKSMAMELAATILAALPSTHNSSLETLKEKYRENVVKFEDEELKLALNEAMHSHFRSPYSNLLDNESSNHRLLQDGVHQLLLHGAATSFARFLCVKLGESDELSVRRALFCIQLLLLETPPQMTTKVACYDGFSCVRALCEGLPKFTRTTQMEIVTLLTGFIASCAEVARVVTSMGAWNELSTVLVTNAEEIKCDADWLKGALANIQQLEDDPGGNIRAFKVDRLCRHKERHVHGSQLEGSEHEEDQEEDSLAQTLQKMLFETAHGGLDSKDEQHQRSAQLMYRNKSQPNMKTMHLTTGATVPMKNPGSRPSTANARYGHTNYGHSRTQPTKDWNGGDSPYNVQMPLPDEYQLRSAPELRRPRSAGYSSRRRGGSPARETKFVRSLLRNPLGIPVNPDTCRKLLRENNGRLPHHVPFALGGPPLGPPPGPDYGSKVKRPQSAHLGSRTRDGLPRAASRPLSGRARHRVAPQIKVIPSESANRRGEDHVRKRDTREKTNELSWKRSLKKAKEVTMRAQRHTQYVAHRLFSDALQADARSRVEAAQAHEDKRKLREEKIKKEVLEESGKFVNTDPSADDAAGVWGTTNELSPIDRLSFKEKLTTMLMQCQELC